MELGQPDRRLVLKGAALTAAVVGVGMRLFDGTAAAAPAADGVFGYGVASGDPTSDAVVIWTRATPPPTRRGEPVAAPGSGLGHPLRVRWEVARDPAFRHVVRAGTVWTSAESDHTVKVDVRGLRPYTRYHYRFHTAGQTSDVGLTRTAPDEAERTHALRFALLSCSNYPAGLFTPYRAVGERDDLDFVLHVGDYIYEGDGDDEAFDLTGYRLRHALHKADPHLRLAHRRHPWITIFDDHEVADNTWSTGAGNTDPAGDFARRRQAAYQAYLEWMPFRLPDQAAPHRGTRFFRRFRFGDLADLSVLETRQNRSAQVFLPPYSTPGGGFVPVGTPEVDAALADPSRHMVEPEQLAWLKETTTQPRRWHLVGNQTVFTPIRFPGAVVGFPDRPVIVNSDQWDGYGADQSALIAHLAAQPTSAGDAVFLTGDIHSSWANDIPAGPRAPGYASAGVEFVCPSVTSDGFYELIKGTLPTGTPVATLLGATAGAVGGISAANPWIRYLNGVSHGFTLVDVTRERVQADFHHTPVPSEAVPDPRTDPTTRPVFSSGWQTLAGTRTVVPAPGPIGPRSDEPH
ncbi:alkaline phosphatase D family protein [Actinokineospora auranticolor]|uniref:Alkaline phosphatase D n=1 Tax=Actinokineospora auranticolor TaxID=155976 RepID=A0A2S6GDH0_9PSEU|nr:alkaline phosphatase D family protein [Actinokineospora auranticolor]PPK63283.1 alkaline phosphatase D [Actinokineospora auranticolor]